MGQDGGGGGGESHSVKQGETLLSIAKEKGFHSWEVIWNHEKNAELRKKRQDPQVLSEGDALFIPEKNTDPILIETNRRHTFVVKTLKAAFRTVVQDDLGKPLGNRRFRLKVGEESLGGITDEDGVIELEIDPEPAEGKLEVYLETQPERILTWNLKLGHLDPIEKLSGVKARLTNLGFLCGEIDDEELNDETKKALRDFQIVYRLKVTGEADQATRQKLLYAHDHR